MIVLGGCREIFGNDVDLVGLVFGVMVFFVCWKGLFLSLRVNIVFCILVVGFY